MRRARFIFGAVFILIGVAALFGFESFKNWFLFLSPDRSVTPYLWLMMQICLVSLGVFGIFVVLFDRFLALAVRLDVFLGSINSRTFLIRFLTLALLLRVAVVFLMPFNLWQDFQCYDELGWQWATDGDYLNGPHPTAYWPPGYPFFLSRLYLVFGHEPFVGALVNITLGVGVVWLSYLIARHIWDERIARWTLLIMALFPSQLLFTSVLASETLFTPLFLAALLLFMKGSADRRWWLPVLVGGVLLGMATLTRSIAKLYLIPVVVYWLLETGSIRRSVIRSGLALIGFAIIVSPWMIRNQSAVGSTCISTNGGINLFIGNQPSSGMGYNHHAALEFDLWDPTQEAYIDSAASARAWDYIAEKPLSFLVRGVMKTMFFYAVDVDALDFELFRIAEGEGSDRYLILGYIAESYWLIVLAAGFLGLGRVFSTPDGRSSGAIMLLLTILYWTGIHFVFFGIGRFHFPIVPAISAFSAVYLASRIDRPARRAA